jgi:F-type H+-transporting ATPase subunit a
MNNILTMPLINFSYSSPLDQFEVTNLISINAPILGYLNLSLTNLGLYSLIVLTLILSFHLITLNNNKIIPSKWNISLETFFASINSMVRDNIGSANEIYFPFIYSLFLFIIISNLIGNIPYNFTIPTSAIVSIGSSFTIFIGVTILAVSIHRLGFFSYFVPDGTPLALVPLLVWIELVSYAARAVSLGVRLFANMTAGHTLIKILSTFLAQMFASGGLFSILTLIPFSIFIALIGLEIAVSIIQAYVFCILTSSYLKDAIYLH